MVGERLVFRLNLRALVAFGVLFLGTDFATAQNAKSLLRSTKVVRSMTEQELVDLVPVQSGLQYVGCPNCNGGRQERQLEWKIEQPDVVTCKFCAHQYPSEQYPMDEAVEVKNPRGEETQFTYWADESGYRYFFKARRDDEVRKYLARQTLKLAQLYTATGEEVHARRAVVILDRFAQVFPGWCYHYDYPFRQKEIYDGNVKPEDFRAGFRTARWNWWAYHDIPNDLVEAYRLIRESKAIAELSKEQGTDVARRIERDLLRNAGEQVFANRDDCSNMSPSVWRSLVKLARVIDEPRYVHEVVRRFRRLMQEKFFYDGFWYEGTPSYAFQTLTSLGYVLRELQGYSDPPGYVDPVDGTRIDNLDLEQDFPLLTKAKAAIETLRLPNGRLVPVHDTWAYTRVGQPVEDAESYLLPALGHACLIDGEGPRRSEFHLSWSGGYGHQHLDLLSLMLFSHGRESLSDLGYTHTAYRPWAISTVAHNTVLIDGLSQVRGSITAPNDGRLLLADFTKPWVQVVRADGSRAYPGVANKYQRSVLVVEVDAERRYAIDLFEVEGGETHDYFLHGDADAAGQVTADLPTKPLATLLPAGFDWKPTVNEGQSGRAIEPHYSYGFLRNLQTADINSHDAVTVDFRVAEAEQQGLRVTLCPEPDSQLVLGENPSVRQAEEDDNQLNEHHRPFMMLRHLAKESGSRFVAVIEPFDGEAFITSVRRKELESGALVLQIEIGELTDTIVFDASERILVRKDSQLSFAGRVGVIRTRQDKVERAYAAGEGGWQDGDFKLAGLSKQQAKLVAVESNALVMKGSDLTLPKPGEIVSVVTEDGWVYPYHVSLAVYEQDTTSIRVEVVEGPGFQFDAAKKQLQFSAYPQREHQGAVSVEWQPTVSWPAEE